MKLNIDLLRKILMYIENNSNGYEYLSNIELDDYTKTEIIYHIRLLLDGGFIVGEILGLNEKKIRVHRMTLKGHQYLESIREKYIWEEVKRQLELKGLKNVSLDILKDFSNKLIRDKLGI